MTPITPTPPSPDPGGWERLGLLRQHQQLLIDRAIAPEVAQRRGVYSAHYAQQLAELGFTKDQQRAPALVTPIHNTGGPCGTHQIRPDQPRYNGEGKPLKYENPRGAKLSLDVPPAVRDQLRDARVPLWITEGPLKADAAVSNGLCCIDVLGVASWRTNEAQADWDSIALARRQVILAFDSDLLTKPAVHRELERLAGMLERRHAYVQFLHLDYWATDGEKLGLDDALARGITPEELLRRVDNVLPPERLDGSSDSKFRAGGSKGRTVRLAWKPASAIVPATFQWIDRPYFARGELQGIAGDGGLGKSTFSQKMAADISRGRTRTGEPTHPQTVILVSAEDAEHKVRSNLELLDADLDNTFVVSGMFDEVIGEEGDVEGYLIDEAGVAALDGLVAKLHPAAVFIDPIAETIPFAIDAHKASPVRLVLARLRRLARKQNCAVIYLIHLTKAGGHAERAQHRVQMSEAFVSAARSMVMINRHPEDEGQRVIMHAKTNLAEYGPSLACSFSEEEGWRWEGEVDVSADASFVAPPEKESGLVDAIIWLVRHHRRQTRVAREVIAEARAQDIEEHTLRRAYQRLGGKAAAVHEKGKRGVVGWDWPAVLKVEKDDDDVLRAAVSSKPLSSKYSGVETPNYLDNTHLDDTAARRSSTAVQHAPSEDGTAGVAEHAAEDVKDASRGHADCSICQGQDPTCWLCGPIATPGEERPNGKAPVASAIRIGTMCPSCFQILLPSGCGCPRGDS